MDEAGTCIHVRPRFVGDQSVTGRQSRSAILGRCTSIVSCWAVFQAVWLFAPYRLVPSTVGLPLPNFTTATEIDCRLPCLHAMLQPQRPSQSACSTIDSAYLIAPAWVYDFRRRLINLSSRVIKLNLKDQRAIIHGSFLLVTRSRPEKCNEVKVLKIA